MPSIQDIIACLESWAPPAYQESYDNAGLQVGEPAVPVRGVLVALDATEAVVDEAVRRGCNLVVAHHPVIFKALRKLTPADAVGRTVLSAVRHGVALYAAHTNLDHVRTGVNLGLARRLGLGQVRILAPKAGVLQKLTVFVPVEAAAPLLDALYAAGAGRIGNYAGCSFRVAGTGTFTPGDGAAPHIGRVGRAEEVAEHRVEVLVPAPLAGRVLAAMRGAHPYEEVAYYLAALENESQDVGAGAVGVLPAPLPEAEFLRQVKAQTGAGCVRHTALRGRPVRTVAVCGGAGVFLLPDAVRAGADALVTADAKYHDFFGADGRILLADIGHYESEVHTKDLIVSHLSHYFPTIAVNLAETVTNPVFYL